MPEAVVFDLDGVLLDSEQMWNEAKQAVVAEEGGEWLPAAHEAMLGMSSPEWSSYMRDELGVPLEPERINELVVARMAAAYEAGLPLLPGARETVLGLASRWPLGLASSANREIIDLFLDLSGLRTSFTVSISSEQVGAGKPSPDVYLEAASRLGAEPEHCVAIEDSANGIRAAVAAGMPVVVVPNPHFPPSEDALALAAAGVGDVSQVTPELIEEVSR